MSTLCGVSHVVFATIEWIKILLPFLDQREFFRVSQSHIAGKQWGSD